MSLHSDLIEQAKFLVKREPRRPRQASLRRAVSAAYHSLFHLLTLEASRLFVKDEDMIGMIVRSYEHKSLLKIAKSFANEDFPRKLNPAKATLRDPKRRAVFDKLKDVAQSFVDLQQARHDADYNLRKNWTRGESKDKAEQAEKAAEAWQEIRNDDFARIFLGCFLVWDDWHKER
jgi:hypothetical protein